jgi:hypothetical protein
MRWFRPEFDAQAMSARRASKAEDSMPASQINKENPPRAGSKASKEMEQNPVEFIARLRAVTSLSAPGMFGVMMERARSRTSLSIRVMLLVRVD